MRAKLQIVTCHSKSCNWWILSRPTDWLAVMKMTPLASHETSQMHLQINIHHTWISWSVTVDPGPTSSGLCTKRKYLLECWKFDTSCDSLSKLDKSCAPGYKTGLIYKLIQSYCSQQFLLESSKINQSKTTVAIVQFLGPISITALTGTFCWI